MEQLNNYLSFSNEKTIKKTCACQETLHFEKCKKKDKS